MLLGEVWARGGEGRWVGEEMANGGLAGLCLFVPRGDMLSPVLNPYSRFWAASDRDAVCAYAGPSDGWRSGCTYEVSPLYMFALSLPTVEY